MIGSLAGCLGFSSAPDGPVKESRVRSFVEAGGTYDEWVLDGCTPMRVTYTSFCADACASAHDASHALCGYECGRWELGGRMGSAFTPEGLEDFYLTTSRRKLQERVVGGASGRVCVPWASRCGSFCAAACEMTLTSGLATCGYDCSRWELGAPSFQFVNDVLGSAAVQSEMESGELLRVVERADCVA